ncbi:MAG: hypothetical protein GXY03_07280 [Solirubrobacterales bacterium]|nr:hypothetical protein [Solirubrobacterales bacterium]
MKLNKIADAAKKALDSRGGTDGLKRDVEKLRDIAMSEGSPKERAQRAADHFKQPAEPEGGERPAG